MRYLARKVRTLSPVRQFVLVGAVLSLLSVFMPWHTVGVIEQHSFNGFGDQNLIIGLIVFVFGVLTVALLTLPLVGIRLPTLRWRESSVLMFLGGEAALLTLVLLIMQVTSLARAVSFEPRLGIYLALSGTLMVFFGGHFLRGEESVAAHGHHEPLTRVPRQHTLQREEGEHTAHHREEPTPRRHVPTEQTRTAEESEADRRMRLDI